MNKHANSAVNKSFNFIDILNLSSKANDSIDQEVMILNAKLDKNG